jgi:hypothetical protein
LTLKQSVDLDALRAKIDLLGSGVSRVRRVRVPSGWEGLDRQIGGLPRPGLMEICGPIGSGRTRIGFRFVVQARGQGQQVAWVDSEHTIYPPAAFQEGIDLAGWALIRTPLQAHDRLAWVVEQILRSGCFPLVVVDVPQEMRLRHVGYRWARASEQGGSSAILLTERPYRGLPVEVRIQVGGGVARVLKDRGSSSTGGREIPLPRVA